MYTPNPMDTTHVQIPEELKELTQLMAKNCHEVWAKNRIEQGWTYGPERNDAEKKHPCLVPYEDLTEEEKSYDVNTCLETIKLILSMDFHIGKRIHCSTSSDFKNYKNEGKCEKMKSFSVPKD